MKIILSELDNLLFPECYVNSADLFKNEKAYLQYTNADDYFAGISNIKFTIKVAKLSMTIKNPEARGAIQYLYEKHIDQFLDWHKAYEWYELKSILMFFIVFSHTSSFHCVEKRLKTRNTCRMVEKYKFIQEQCSPNGRSLCPILDSQVQLRSNNL